MLWGRVIARALEPAGKQGFRGGMMAMEKALEEGVEVDGEERRATASVRAGPQ